MESNGVWVVTSIEARNFICDTQDIHVSKTKEDGEKAFIEIVKAKLKREKEVMEIIAEERFGDEPIPGKTLRDYINFIKKDGESFWYGMEKTDSNMVFTGSQQIINRIGEYEISNISIQLNYISYDKTVDISQIIIDNLPSVEELFQEV